MENLTPWRRADTASFPLIDGRVTEIKRLLDWRPALGESDKCNGRRPRKEGSSHVVWLRGKHKLSQGTAGKTQDPPPGRGVVWSRNLGCPGIRDTRGSGTTFITCYETQNLSVGRMNGGSACSTSTLLYEERLYNTPFRAGRAEEAEEMPPEACFLPLSAESPPSTSESVNTKLRSVSELPRGFSFLRGHFLTRRRSVLRNCPNVSIWPIK